MQFACIHRVLRICASMKGTPLHHPSIHGSAGGELKSRDVGEWLCFGDVEAKALRDGGSDVKLRLIALFSVVLL